jgi:hypothetical protein
MIIETPYKEQDVVSMKLASGEEILGKLESETDAKLKVSKPFALVPSQQGLGLMPYMLSVSPDAKVEINKTNVVCIAKTEQGIASQYFQQTTGLTVI